jgi:hypothetical protein
MQADMYSGTGWNIRCFTAASAFPSDLSTSTSTQHRSIQPVCYTNFDRLGLMSLASGLVIYWIDTDD